MRLIVTDVEDVPDLEGVGEGIVDAVVVAELLPLPVPELVPLPVAEAGPDGGAGADCEPNTEAVPVTHALALRSDGSVWAWGGNASGQLGDGSFKPSRIPVATGLGQIVRIRAGGDVSMAISQRRALYLWGENADGQLGLGSAATTDVGVPTAALRDMVDGAAGDRGSIALGSNGLLVAAGANDAGSLGDGGTTARNSFAAVSVVSQGIAVDIGGLSFAAAIGADGTTWTWGDNSSKQLGNASITTTSTPTPTVVPSFDAIP